ncbi:hypothetical protein AQ768_22185 [Burkholderia pseudomallei]|nr:hypothetical protein AQ768_22185 [Burkholderia pseudomallei]
MPALSVSVFDIEIDSDLADVVQQRRIGSRRRPGFRLCGLYFGRRSHRQQTRLPQLQRIRDDLQPMVQHAAGKGVVMAFGGWELLDQRGVAFDRRAIERGELRTRERCTLPDMFQQFPSAR